MIERSDNARSSGEALADAKAEIVAAKKENRARKVTIRAAEADLHAKKLDVLRERYRDAFGQCADGERMAAARQLFAAAAIFERDARHFPRRITKAVAQMELAVFMLAGKVRP